MRVAITIATVALAKARDVVDSLDFLQYMEDDESLVLLQTKSSQMIEQLKEVDRNILSELVAKDVRCTQKPATRSQIPTIEQCQADCEQDAHCSNFAYFGMEGNEDHVQTTCMTWRLADSHDCTRAAVRQGLSSSFYQVHRNNQPTSLVVKMAADTASAFGDPHIIRGGELREDVEKNGHANLLTIPQGSNMENASLKIVAETQKMGTRPNDLWIRRIVIQGSWLKGHRYAFKTGSGTYGDPNNYLAKIADGEWTAPENVLKFTNGQMQLAKYDKEIPHLPCESSPHQEVKIMAGPADIRVRYTTSKKDELLFNHLDIWVSGLSKVRLPLGGIFADEDLPPSEENLMQMNKPQKSEPLKLWR